MLRIMSPGIDILRKLIGGTMDFSFEEKVVGKWINGKPVYQITIERDFASNNDILVENVDTLITYFGSLKYVSTGNVHNYPYQGSPAIEGIVDTSNNFIISGIGNWSDFKCTILYTKTTD